MNAMQRTLHLLVFTFVMLLSAPSLAAGSFKLKNADVEEVSGAWHIYVTVELPKAPLTAHQSMRFVFTKTAEFERTLVDGKSEPVLNKVIVNTGRNQVESMDVDF